LRPIDYENLTNNIFRNSAVIFLCRIVSTVLQLFTIPVILHFIGMEGFGVWETLLAICHVFVFLQYIVSGTMLWKLPGYFAENRHNTIAKTVSYGITFYLLCFIILWPLILLFSNSILRWMNIDLKYFESSLTILPIVFAFVILNAVTDLFIAVINSSQRAGQALAISTVSNICNYIVVILFLQINFGLYSLMIGIVAGNLFNLVMSVYKAKKICAEITIMPALIRFSELRGVYRYSINLSIGSFASFLRGQADKIVLAYFASSTWVGYYGIANRIASQLMEVSSFFYISIITSASALRSLSDSNAIRALYSKMSFVLSTTGGLAFAVMAGCYNEILIFWVNRVDKEVVIIMLLLLLSNYIAIALTGAGTAICKGLGKIEIETKYLLINMLLNIFLTVGLVATVGALGTVIASAISWTISAIIFSKMFHDKLGYNLDRNNILVLLISLFTPVLSYFIRLEFLLRYVSLSNNWLLFFECSMTIISFCTMLFIFRVLRFSDLNRIANHLLAR
jgi:O-antigen/teichoic acid export membrane protein